MSRSYSPRIVALAVGANVKWVDNLLSHHTIPGVTQGRRGMERKINDIGVLAVGLVQTLSSQFGIGVKAAVPIVVTAIESRDRDEGRFVTASGVALFFPFDEIERTLRGRLVEAMEAVGHVPRGRPRRPVQRETPS